MKVRKITLLKPVFPKNQDPAEIKIQKVGHRRYRVDRIQIAGGTKVTWSADGFTAREIVVFFPPTVVLAGEKQPSVIVPKNAPCGTYHYSLFVHVDGAYCGVDGNSPPEMVIE